MADCTPSSLSEVRGACSPCATGDLVWWRTSQFPVTLSPAWWGARHLHRFIKGGHTAFLPSPSPKYLVKAQRNVIFPEQGKWMLLSPTHQWWVLSDGDSIWIWTGKLAGEQGANLASFRGRGECYFLPLPDKSIRLSLLRWDTNWLQRGRQLAHGVGWLMG